MKSMLLFTSLLFFVALNQVAEAVMCPHRCDCPAQPPSCPAGSELIRDGCDCCMVCARLEGQSCDLVDAVCDHRLQLECDFAASRDGNYGVCRVRQGRSCIDDGAEIASGEVWEIACKEKCWCMDGFVGCVPLCPPDTKVPDPALCPSPRLVQPADECCPRWECDDMFDNRLPAAQPFRMSNDIGGNAIYDEDIGDVGDELLDYQIRPFEERNHPQNHRFNPHSSLDEDTSLLTNYLPGDVHEYKHVTAAVCRPKATQWTACSKTCGLGTSTRMSNDNLECRIERQTRLCMLRPCHDPESLFTPQKRQCIKQKRSTRRESITYAGCKSIRKFRMRFCGLCHQDTNKCCTPKLTRTVSVDLACADGSVISKKLMSVRSCHCSKHCVSRDRKQRNGARLP